MTTSFKDYGLVTTPQLHWLAHANQTLFDEEHLGTEDYVNHLSAAFINFCKLSHKAHGKGKVKDKSYRNYVPHISVDCGNGVGSLALSQIAEKVNDWLCIDLYNKDMEEATKLGHKCGAGFVFETGAKPAKMNMKIERHAALDTVGERLIYFGEKKDTNFPPTAEVSVADGDKQFSMIMLWIREKLANMELEEKVSHALIQTAYTNGACTHYLKTIGVK